MGVTDRKPSCPEETLEEKEEDLLSIHSTLSTPPPELIDTVKRKSRKPPRTGVIIIHKPILSKGLGRKKSQRIMQDLSIWAEFYGDEFEIEVTIDDLMMTRISAFQRLSEFPQLLRMYLEEEETFTEKCL